jgi:hypothetical protein
MHDVAHLCGALGRHEDALSMSQSALELCRRALPEGNPAIGNKRVCA